VKKKIGILTIHRNNNPGSFLQAYSQLLAFQEKFKAYDVEIIDYEFISQEISLLKGILLNAITLNFQPLKEKLIFRKAIKEHLSLSKKSLLSDDYKKSIDFIKNKYDVIVIGSDELWKTISDKFPRPFPNIYWLSPKINSKKIAFAVSANRCEIKDIKPKNCKIANELLSDFDFIGLRDDHTIKILNFLEIYDKKIFKVPDPTFTYSFEKTINDNLKKKLEKIGVNFNKPVIGVYGSFPSNVYEIDIKGVFNYYKEKGYQIVSLKGKHEYSNISLQGILNPLEWAQVFSFCDFCITSTFHGTIFSIKNKTPFLTIEYEEYYTRIKSKIRELLQDMSLMDNYCYLPDIKNNREIIDLLEHAKETFDKQKVNKEIDKMRNKYYHCLDEVAKII
jgi:polysaccharide pyruvyl transferase WcaK-like protein